MDTDYSLPKLTSYDDDRFSSLPYYTVTMRTKPDYLPFSNSNLLHELLHHPLSRYFNYVNLISMYSTNISVYNMCCFWSLLSKIEKNVLSENGPKERNTFCIIKQFHFTLVQLKLLFSGTTCDVNWKGPVPQSIDRTATVFFIFLWFWLLSFLGKRFLFLSYVYILIFLIFPLWLQIII